MARVQGHGGGTEAGRAWRPIIQPPRPRPRGADQQNVGVASAIIRINYVQPAPDQQGLGQPLAVTGAGAGVQRPGGGPDPILPGLAQHQAQAASLIALFGDQPVATIFASQTGAIFVPGAQCGPLARLTGRVMPGQMYA